ncbi:helix-turn-helix domain-containing protein [Gallaecimonas mangrovi]|uniref:helix-turn-helix domain-containing protein n=1 Tax=Gallaecimonas mangrovi TaxID=2291597 RepID=UPI000E203A3D|nr:AraC family transcriptional regulator [Gallaecimonas mangrovi]
MLQKGQVDLDTSVRNKRAELGRAFAINHGKSKHSGQWHSHPESQLMWISQGCVSIETGRGRWLVPAGRIGWFPGHEMHRATGVGQFSGITLFVLEDWLDYPTVFEGSELSYALLKALLEPLDDEVRLRRLAVLADEVRHAKPLSVGLPMPFSTRLKALCEQLVQEQRVSLGLEQAATQVAMSRRSFSRHFKQETGLSYGQWLQLAKVQNSLAMLTNGQRVGDVALAVGYDTVSAFCQVFKEVTGQSPGRWQLSQQTLNNNS